MLKVSQLLNSEIHPLVHGALISRIVVSEEENYFAAVSAYQKSTKVTEGEFDFDSYTKTYIETLNSIISSNQWISYEDYKNHYDYCNLPFRGKEKAILLIENDLKIPKSSFYNRLYFKLFNDCPWFMDESFNEEKKHFIRGFCELRGSIDTTRPLIAMDYFYDNTFELGKARLLNEYLSVPYYLININFRELQDQYIRGINKRNTQLRLQLNWYVKNIGLINDYKTKIVEKVYHVVSINKINNINYLNMPDITPDGSDLFITRLNHFSNKIFGKELNDHDIFELRNELDFDITKSKISTFKRNNDIVELVRIYTADECAGCKSIHELSDRTFTHRRTGRPYFEIHHNISLNNTVELDHENNLVKLCPVCHSTLKRGVGLENEQKEIIANIIKSDSNILDFASHFFDTADRNILIDKIYENLR